MVCSPFAIVVRRRLVALFVYLNLANLLLNNNHSF